MGIVLDAVQESGLVVIFLRSFRRYGKSLQPAALLESRNLSPKRNPDTQQCATPPGKEPWCF